MKVIVTRQGGPFPVSFDGIHVVNVSEGEVHEFDQELGTIWESRGWVERCEKIEIKAEAAAPENKMETPVENKEPKVFSRHHKARGKR